MTLKIFHLFLIATLFCVGYGQFSCADDTCDLTAPHTTDKGYACVQRGTDNVLCRCPNGEYELNKPCRLCARTNDLQNACNRKHPNYIGCVEQGDYASSYVCICLDSTGTPAATTSWDCDLSVTLTSTTTTAPPSLGGLQCSNGGVQVGDVCHCPSGFEGGLCERRNEANLCERITCKNSGVKQIRQVNGVFQCVCACRSGTSGDFCELTGTLGTCATAGCANSADCRQVTISTTTHSYCECRPGFKGSKCETQYFTCPAAGFFTDIEMFEQGKYFQCTASGTSFNVVRRSCAKGLRYSMTRQKCTY